MFFQNLKLTAIDVQGTRRPEDGFCVDVTTNDICFATIIPDRKFCNFDAVAQAIEKQMPKRHSRIPFFSDEESGLSRMKPHEVIVLHMQQPDHTLATLHIGQATIRRRFTFEEVDTCKDDIELYALGEYVKKEHKITTVAPKELVATPIFKINDAAEYAMKANGIPYLGHHEGKISMYLGSCKINRPLRDAVSLVNTFQLAHFLKTGEILFTREEISKFAAVPHSNFIDIGDGETYT